MPSTTGDSLLDPFSGWRAAAATRRFNAARDVAYVCGFFAVGVWVLGEVEGMKHYDSVYLLAATVTTVGYGDVTPRTLGGRWFLTAWMPLGIFLVSAAFVRSSAVVKSAIRYVVLRTFALCGVDQVDVFDMPIDEASPADVAKRLKYWFRYLVAAAPVASLFLAFVALVKTQCGGAWGGAIYFAMATCTTVGYGDRNFADAPPAAKYAISVLLVVFVCVFADCVGECLLIRQRQRLRNGDIALPTPGDLERLLLDKARRRGAGDDGDAGEPRVSEADYVIWTLSTGNLVDDQILLAIRRAFHWDAASHEAITPADVHAHHVRRRGPVATPSYHDWCRDDWLPKLEAARSGGRAARERRRRSRLVSHQRRRRSQILAEPLAPPDGEGAP